MVGPASAWENAVNSRGKVCKRDGTVCAAHNLKYSVFLHNLAGLQLTMFQTSVDHVVSLLPLPPEY